MDDVNYKLKENSVLTEALKNMSISYKESKENQTKKKPDVSLRLFEYIYKNKIQPGLDKKHNTQSEMKGKFQFTDMNLLMDAYEYFRYENVNR